MLKNEPKLIKSARLRTQIVKKILIAKKITKANKEFLKPDALIPCQIN